ncbi:DUF2085 domain-containing protein [Halorientalis halophila]|uniref:DUF2085 domain-containing protein n=1 Tax=Halorientalis halophila TaxID=3108499 RepID=UPI0030088A86
MAHDESSVPAEIRAGLRRTAPFFLSHHLPDEYHRCHTLSIRGRTVRLCARCSGIYPGIVLGMAAALWGLWRPWHALAILAFPAPALVQWALVTFGDRRGRNATRTVTGLLLGVGYGLGVVTFLGDPFAPVPLVAAIGYGGLAGVLLYLERARSATVAGE